MANSVDKEYHDVLVGRYNTLKEHYDEIYNKINHENFKTFDELTLTVSKEPLEKQIDLLAAKYVLLVNEFYKLKQTKYEIKNYGKEENLLM